jgi:hypothetical protein
VYTLKKGETFSPQFDGVTTVDPSGTGYTSWSVTTKHGCNVYYAYSRNRGKSWSAPIQVTHGPGCSTFPWIDAHGRSGALALAYYDTPSTKQQKGNEGAAYQDNVRKTARWFVHVAYIGDADTSHPNVIDRRVPFPHPVFLGPLLRQGWDYLGVSLWHDGVIRAVFVDKYRDSAPRTWFVQTKERF